MLTHIFIPKRGADVVILQHGLIVIQQRQITSGINVKRVGGSVVFVIVNCGGVNRGEDLDVGEPLDDARVGEQLVRRLRDVGAVQHVVIRVAMTTVASLDGAQKFLQNGRVYFVFVLQTVSLQQFEHDETQSLCWLLFLLL